MWNVQQSYEKDVLKNIKNKIKTTYSRLKILATIDRNCWCVVYGKITKGLPPLRRPKLSKKSQEKDDEILRKLYKSNRKWNDCRFQLHWNKLEWFNPRSNILRKKPIRLLQ